jgi:hypothetical protein
VDERVYISSRGVGIFAASSILAITWQKAHRQMHGAGPTNRGWPIKKDVNYKQNHVEANNTFYAFQEYGHFTFQ